jgi:3-dehydroquinate synthase
MKKILMLGVGLLVLFSVLFVAAEQAGYTEPEYVRGLVERVHRTGGGRAAVAALVVLLLSVDLLLPVPSSVVMAFSGMFLGAVLGTLVSFAGAMLAALIGFYICRRGGRAAFERLVGAQEEQRITDWFRRRGVVAIILSRPVPMLTEILSCLAGLSELSPRTFTAAAALGTLPVCAIYAWVGSRGDVTNPWPAVWISLALPAAGWLVAGRLTGGGDAPDGETDGS